MRGVEGLNHSTVINLAAEKLEVHMVRNTITSIKFFIVRFPK